MILILFGVGVVARSLRRRGGSATTTRSPGPGASASTLGVYAAARLERGAPQPGGDHRAWPRSRASQWRKVRAVLAGADCSARSSAALIVRRFTYADLHQRHRPRTTPSRRRASSPRCPATGHAGVGQPDRLLRPDRRHRDPGLRHLRGHHGGQQPAAGQPGPCHRPAGRRDRHGVGRQRRLRDQPGP